MLCVKVYNIWCIRVSLWVCAYTRLHLSPMESRVESKRKIVCVRGFSMAKGNRGLCPNVLDDMILFVYHEGVDGKRIQHIMVRKKCIVLVYKHGLGMVVWFSVYTWHLLVRISLNYYTQYLLIPITRRLRFYYFIFLIFQIRHRFKPFMSYLNDKTLNSSFYFAVKWQIMLFMKNNWINTISSNGR